MVEVKKKLSKKALYLMDRLEEGGYEAYLVGGCIRDVLLGKDPCDWDICTSAFPQEVKLCFSGMPVIETGLKHGTVTVVYDGEAFEITTFREEGDYADHRRPDHVTFVGSLRQDLNRRDFTINAMAYHPKKGLLDYFSGLQDLKERRIRCVGDAQARFSEDPLRIMRVIRFASQLSFQVESATRIAANQQKDLLHWIAPERISVEFQKLLNGEAVKQILMENYPILSVFIPELLPMVSFYRKNIHHRYDLWRHTVESVAAAPKDKILRLSLFFHDIAKPSCYVEDGSGVGYFSGHSKLSSEMTFEILHRLRMDKETIRRVKELVFYHDMEIRPELRSVKRWLNRIGEEGLRQLIEVKRADVFSDTPLCRDRCNIELKEIEGLLKVVLEEKQCYQQKDLAIDGRDLVNLGVPQGARIGAILRWLVDMVIEGKIENDRKKLLNAVVEKIEGKK